MLSKDSKDTAQYSGGVICTIYLYVGSYVFRQELLKGIFAVPGYLKVVSIILWMLVAAFVPGMDIGSGSLGYSIVGFTISIIGTFVVLGMCEHFHLNFNWFGRNTLNILCAHILLWRILEVFGYSSTMLPFDPQVNFLIEVTYEVFGALFLALLISKTHILEYKKMFE